MSETSAPVALVTGGGVGIGKAIALALANVGYDIVLTYHSQPADVVVHDIQALGRRAISISVDAVDSPAVATAVNEVSAEFGRLDVLVNNVGGLVGRTSIASMTNEHWRTVMDVNVSSTFYFTRASIGLLGRGGRIINLSSLAAQNGGGAGGSAYAAAKAALIGFTRAAAKELGPDGITVNAIAPGFIDDTPFHAAFSTSEAKTAMIASAAVGRAGRPADVSAVVTFLASPEASFITGAVIDLNGGSYFS